MGPQFPGNNQPTPRDPYQPSPPDPLRHSGLSIVGFLLALVGLFIAWVPVIGFIGVFGLALGIAGLHRARTSYVPERTGLAIAAIVIGVFDLSAALFWLLVYGALSQMSCPHIYAWDGTTWHLDADPLSGSLFAAAESDDFDRLEHLLPTDGSYRIRVADELQETDYIDGLRLLIVDHPEGEEVLPTQAGQLLRFHDATIARSATIGNGRDISAIVSTDDGSVFIGNPAEFPSDQAGDPRDTVTLEFPRPEGNEATLALRTSTTPFAVEAFTAYLAEMGPGLGSLLHYAEDAKAYPYKQRVADELRRLGLVMGIEVWDGAQWVTAGELRPIGPATLREQAIRVPLPGVKQETVRVRLSMTPGFWQIDRARLAPGVETVKAQHSVAPKGGGEASSERAAALMGAWDEQRLVLRTGQSAEVRFDAPPPAAVGMSRTVVLQIRGFYEVKVGGRGLINPLAVIAHRNGSMTLPRYAIRLSNASKR